MEVCFNEKMAQPNGFARRIVSIVAEAAAGKTARHESLLTDEELWVALH